MQTFQERRTKDALERKRQQEVRVPIIPCTIAEASSLTNDVTGFHGHDQPRSEKSIGGHLAVSTEMSLQRLDALLTVRLH
jgi:hypothetical protein